MVRIPDSYWLPPEDFPIGNLETDPWHQGADPWSVGPAARNQPVAAQPPAKATAYWTQGAGGWEHQTPPPQWEPGPQRESGPLHGQLQVSATRCGSAPPIGGAPPKAAPLELGPPPTRTRPDEDSDGDPGQYSDLLTGPRSPSRAASLPPQRRRRTRSRRDASSANGAATGSSGANSRERRQREGGGVAMPEATPRRGAVPQRPPQDAAAAPADPLTGEPVMVVEILNRPVQEGPSTPWQIPHMPIPLPVSAPQQYWPPAPAAPTPPIAMPPKPSGPKLVGVPKARAADGTEEDPGAFALPGDQGHPEVVERRRARPPSPETLTPLRNLRAPPQGSSEARRNSQDHSGFDSAEEE